MSRRTWLKNIAVVALSAALPAGAAPAAESGKEKKVAKSVVHYQDQPNAGKMCGMCRYFIPAGGTAGHGMMGGMMGPGMMAEGNCRLVEGHISPMGYCILYTPL